MVMSERRVRPNGLIAGGQHPPIFHELLHRRTDDGSPWGGKRIHSPSGAIETLAAKIARQHNAVASSQVRFVEYVRPRYGEYTLSLFTADEGDDRL